MKRERAIPEADDSIGVEPDSHAQTRAHNPARGKARGRIDPVAQLYQVGLRDTDRRRERSPEVERRVKENVPGRPPFDSRFLHQAIGQPDENQSGRTRGERNDTWARSVRNGATPVCGSKPARGAGKPRSAAGREMQGRRRLRRDRPARPRMSVSRSGTPR
jgi:hypothetical protein